MERGGDKAWRRSRAPPIRRRDAERHDGGEEHLRHETGRTHHVPDCGRAREHQDPPDCATGALLLAAGADEDASVELELVVDAVVVDVMAAAAVLTAFAFFAALEATVVLCSPVLVEAVAFACTPITAAMSAAAAVEAAATAPVTRLTRCLPAVR